MKKTMLFMIIVILLTCFSSIHGDEFKKMDDSKVADGSEIKSPIILQSATPGFPMKARADRVEGFVTIKFTVTKDGNVGNPVVVESVPDGYFERAALNALEKYKFEPATENGVAIDYPLEWPFFFRFPDSVFSENMKDRMQACRYADMGKRSIDKADYQAAVKDLTKAVELETQFGTAYYYRSLAYMDLEDYDKAITDIDKAMELSPGVFGFLNHRGTIYLLNKEYQKAIEDFTKSLDLEPRNIIAYINRGDAFRLSKKYDDAITDYTSALGLNEKLIHVHNNRGYTYYKMDNKVQACKDFKTACELGDCRALNMLKVKDECQE